MFLLYFDCFVCVKFYYTGLLQSELKKLTRSDDEDEALDQIEILTDFFEKREKPMTEFEEPVFEGIVDKIVVIDQHELEFHLIGGLKFKEKI